MRSRWKQFEPFDPDRGYVVLASSIPARSRRSTPRMFRGAGEVRAQLARTEGVVGFALLARPITKHYATLSVWRDEESLRQFATAGRHGELMAELRAEMNEPKFLRWTITGSDGRPSWREALDRLAAARST